MKAAAQDKAEWSCDKALAISQVIITCAWWRHLVNAYGVISLVRLIAAALRRCVAASCLAKPSCYTWPACRYSLCCPVWQLVDRV